MTTCDQEDSRFLKICSRRLFIKLLIAFISINGDYYHFLWGGGGATLHVGL